MGDLGSHSSFVKEAGAVSIEPLYPWDIHIDGTSKHTWEIAFDTDL